MTSLKLIGDKIKSSDDKVEIKYNGDEAYSTNTALWVINHANSVDASSHSLKTDQHQTGIVHSTDHEDNGISSTSKSESSFINDDEIYSLQTTKSNSSRDNLTDRVPEYSNNSAAERLVGNHSSKLDDDQSDSNTITTDCRDVDLTNVEPPLDCSYIESPCHDNNNLCLNRSLIFYKSSNPRQLSMTKSATEIQSLANPKVGLDNLNNRLKSHRSQGSINSVTLLRSASQSQVRLKLKKIKLRTLQQFNSKESLSSSVDSVSSNFNDSSSGDDSDTVSITSSFVSLRPCLPLEIDPHYATYNSPKSPSKSCSRLQAFSPHPGFNMLAEKTLSDGTKENLVNSICSSSSSEPSPICSGDEETDVKSLINNVSRPPKRENRSRADSLRNKTHPLPGGKKSDILPGVPYDAIQKESAVNVSHGSLFDSINHTSGSQLLDDIICEMKKTKTPAVKQQNKRPSKSEPFGKEKPFPISADTQGVTRSSPAISSSSSDTPLSPESQEETKRQEKDNEKRKAIVREIVETEEKYVKNLEQIVNAIKVMRESAVLDDEALFGIFYNIRLIDTHVHHNILLIKLKGLLESPWDAETSAIGAIICSTFHSETLSDNYVSYVKNCEQAKELLKQQLTRNTSFIRFNEKFRLQNPSGFDLNHALSVPANRLSSYKLLLQRYHDCTPPGHPDYIEVPRALQIIKELLDVVGKADNRNKESTLKDLEKVLDVSELVTPDREYLRVDTVGIPGHKDDRSLWMFSDLLLITENKMSRRPPSRKDSIVLHGLHGLDIVPGRKKDYRLHKRVGLDNVDVISSPEKEVKKCAKDIEDIKDDLDTLEEIADKISSLSIPHNSLKANVAELISKCRQTQASLRVRRESTDMTSLKLLLQSPEGMEELKVIFKDPKTRSNWEADLVKAKLNLETAISNRLPPQFIERLPIEKTRAGMLFSCAAPVLCHSIPSDKDIWVCNSDSSAGHICRISPNAKDKDKLTSYSALPGCNSRILCICATPVYEQSTEMSDVSENTLHISESTDNLPSLTDTSQSLMWIGCEDGAIHILPTAYEIGKGGQLTIHCYQSVLSLLYIEGKVFASLADGKVLVFKRNFDGLWDINSPHSIKLNSPSSITRMLSVAGKLWCSSQNEITVIDPILEQAERSIKVSKDVKRGVQCMSYSRQGVVCVALQGSCDIKLFHAMSLRHLADINVFSSVAQKLNKCDEIIKQHKTACLKITTLMCCKDLLWVGTTAGVVLTIRLPKLLSATVTAKEFVMPSIEITGLDIGHTGNVRFLTFVEISAETSRDGRRRSVSRQSLVTRMLVVSGGDGYEVIDPSYQSGDDVGFNDSINHLLLWKV